MGVSTSTTIITIINFLIILFVVKHFWFEKISLVIDERRKDIMTNITQAKEDKSWFVRQEVKVALKKMPKK